MQVHTDRRHSSGGAGMAAGQAPRPGLVGPSRSHHPAHGSGHQHRRTRTQERQARHGQANAVGPGAGVKRLGPGTQQGAVGGVQQAFGAAHRHHPVLRDRPREQQLAAADVVQKESGMQLPAREEGCALPAGGQLNGPARQPVRQQANTRHRQHQIRARATGHGGHPAQLGIPQTDRRIAGAQAQGEAGVACELGRGGHHHVGLVIGRLQAKGLGQKAEVSGLPHPQRALRLAASQLCFRAAGKLRRVHGRQGSRARQGGLR